MQSDFLPGKPLEVAQWLGNASTVATANLIAMGLVAADVTSLTTAKTTLDTTITNVTAARDAYKAAVVARKSAMKVAGTTARAVSKKVQAAATCPPNIKKQAGFNVRATPEKQVIPSTPEKLVATGYDNGINLLTWNTAKNKAGTVYRVEAKLPGEKAFRIVTTTTKSRIELKGNIPGVVVEYRVCATRTTLLSGYSNVAVAYGGYGAVVLEMSKAA